MKSSLKWSMISSSVSLLSTLWSITQSYATFDCGCLSIVTKGRFWNQGTLAAWFLQLLTLAMYTSWLLVGGAPAHNHHWVNWKHSILHSLMRQFVGWEGSKTRLCQHMNTFSSFALWTFPALLISDIISWSFYHRYTTSRIVHIW